MERESIQKDPINTAINTRKAEIDYIKQMAKRILANPDKIDSIILGIEGEGETYQDWFGSINGCYGLTKRIGKNLELNMGEMYE